MIDLHCHSTASDGSLTPTELARTGQRAGLTTMALTDHDAASGVEGFLDECKTIGLRGIPGIELSADVPFGQLHLVGLGFDYKNPTLQEKFNAILDGRGSRNLAMIHAFNAIGIDLTMEEVKQYAGEDLVSRVHFAQTLIQRGMVQDLSEAFEKYLGKGACCYRDRFRYSPEDCLQLINNAGGIVMMAHPLSLTTDWVLLEAEIEKLKALGLRGMECFYSTYDLDTTIHLLRIAKRFELIPSVGSDFHGLPKPTIFLGQQHVPEEIEQNLLHALSQTYFEI